MKTNILPINYATAIIKLDWPCQCQGQFIIRGSVPPVCVDQVYPTENDAVEALLAAGVPRFQMADCSWFENKLRPVKG